MSPADIHGNPLNRETRQEPNGSWGTNVWRPGLNGLVIEPPRRYFYRTRREARSANFNDPIGRNGRVA